jgi:hypothetical protein
MLFPGESVTDHPLRESPASTISTWSGSAREQAVQRMFTSIAGVYDLNNTLLSFGLHYRWKKVTAAAVPCVKDGTALDVGAGTADLALFVESRMGAHGRVMQNIWDSTTTRSTPSPQGSACAMSETSRRPSSRFVAS